MNKISGIFKDLNKKQIITVAVVAVVIIALLVTTIVLIAGGKKEENIRTLKITSARLAKTEPVKVTITFTFKGDKLDAVRYDDTYNVTERFEEDLAKRKEDTKGVFDVSSDSKTRTVSYNVSDLSEWKNKSFDELDKQYRADMEWNIIVQEAPTSTAVK